MRVATENTQIKPCNWAPIHLFRNTACGWDLAHGPHLADTWFKGMEEIHSYKRIINLESGAYTNNTHLD